MHRVRSPLTAPTPRRRSRLNWLVPLCALLASCAGGSGSSGFDVAAENSAIDHVLETDMCAVVDDLTICASSTAPSLPTFTATGAPTVEPSATATIAAEPTSTATAGVRTATTTALIEMSRTPTPTLGQPTSPATPTGTPQASTATPTGTAASGTQTPRRTETPTRTPTATRIPPSPSVNIDIPADGILPCQPAGDGLCDLIVSYQVSGAPGEAGYRVAFRNQDPDARWSVVAASDAAAALSVPASGAPYQFAVLIFVPAPSVVPGAVDRLGESGASYAFVTPVLRIEPDTP